MFLVTILTICIYTIPITKSHTMGHSSQECLLFPVFVFSIQNYYFVVLHKSSKIYLISIFIPQRKGDPIPYPPFLATLCLAKCLRPCLDSPTQNILDPPLVHVHVPSRDHIKICSIDICNIKKNPDQLVVTYTQIFCIIVTIFSIYNVI